MTAHTIRNALRHLSTLRSPASPTTRSVSSSSSSDRGHDALYDNPEYATHSSLADLGKITLHSVQQLVQEHEQQLLTADKRQLDLEEALEAIQRNEEVVEALLQENTVHKESMLAARTA